MYSQEHVQGTLEANTSKIQQ